MTDDDVIVSLVPSARFAWATEGTWLWQRVTGGKRLVDVRGVNMMFKRAKELAGWYWVLAPLADGPWEGPYASKEAAKEAGRVALSTMTINNLIHDASHD